MAQQCPTLFRAYVSVGTSAHWTRAYQLRYAHLQEVARRDGNLRALRQLAELGPPPYVSSRTVEQFGQLVWEIDGFSGTARQLTADDLAAAIERSTEYSRDEIATSLVAMQDNLDRFGEFLKGYSMIDSVPKLEVAIYFVEGQHDRNCPIALSREYFEALEAPSGKHWNLFAESAHMPMYEEPQRFLRLLKSIVPV